MGAAHGHRYVVVYDATPGSGFPVQAETAAREGAYGFRSDHRYRHVVDGFAARLSTGQAQALRTDPDVALVARDGLLHAASVPRAAGEQVPTGVTRIGAADQVTVHSPSATAVAVLDTGIDLNHPDLVARAGPYCVGSGPPEDDHGHGTFVAGVIGARNDGAGLVGVAPGTEMYAVKVLGPTGDGYVSDVICGLEWVTANAARLGIRVANMSLSGVVEPVPLHLAIRRSVAAGVVYMAAAGNTGTDLASEVPAAFPEVLTVTAASDSDGAPGGTGPAQSCDVSVSGEIDDSFGTFSNFATTPADAAHVVAAPGVCITSTRMGGGERTSNGTSAAAPHVTGVVALCMGEAGQPSACADMTPAEVIEQIRADAAAHATPENGFIGDPFRPVGVTFGHLVSGVDPTVRRIPYRPATTSAAPVPPDTVIQVIAMRIRRTQDVDRLRVVARVAEPATVTATATVRLPAGAARLVRARGSAQAAPNRRLRVSLRLTPAGLRSTKHALRRGRHVRARVTMTVTDAAGNARTKTRLVRLRP
jgi:subtilisin